MNHSTLNTKQQNLRFHWYCKHTWNKSGKNTLWCLLGCSIGDFGTILFFQLIQHSITTLIIMIIAIINGIITSVLLETFILLRQMVFIRAIQTAFGMSFISMIVMEVTMNAIDWMFTGQAIIVWWIVPIMLISGFVSSLPYNYWKLKKYNISCH